MKKLLLLLLPFFAIAQSPDATQIENIILQNNTKQNSATRVIVQDSITKELKFVLKNNIVPKATATVSGTVRTTTAEVNPQVYTIGIADNLLNAKVDKTTTVNGQALSGNVNIPIPVASVSGRVGAVVLNSVDVGLGNVNNTTDLNKPISIATQTALNAKISGSGTTNQLAKFTSSGAVGNSSIFDNGNVGIGTSNPLNKLHVVDPSGIRISSANNADFRGLVFGGTNNDTKEFASIKYNPNSGEMQIYANPAEFGGFTTFYSNNVESMRIKSNGNLGINTTNPTERLDVVGNGKFSGTVEASPATASNHLVTKAQFDAANNNNVKLTGDQIISGIKVVNNVGSDIYGINNFTFENNGTGAQSAPLVAINRNIGWGLSTLNTSSGNGIHVQNQSSGTGINIDNSSTGNSIVANATNIGTGFNYVGRNNTVNTFTVSKIGTVTASVYRATSIAVHADNSAAISAGLEVGTMYRTSTGVVMIVF